MDLPAQGVDADNEVPMNHLLGSWREGIHNNRGFLAI